MNPLIKGGSSNSTKDNLFYNKNDSAPFRVCVVSVLINSETPISSTKEQQPERPRALHRLFIGKLLFEQRSKDVDHVDQKGRNQVTVSFKSAGKANKLIHAKFFKRHNLKTFIQTNCVTRTGVIRRVDISFSNKEIL